VESLVWMKLKSAPKFGTGLEGKWAGNFCLTGYSFSRCFPGMIRMGISITTGVNANISMAIFPGNHGRKFTGA
jgi:hypothetical protein